MLDDLKYIHERDAQDALGQAERACQQLGYEFESSQQPLKATTVVFAGVGNSAIAAEMCKVWPGLSVPFEMVRDYDLPTYVSGSTYFIAASYTGDDEPVLTALEQAQTRGATIAIITSGGQLAQIAHDGGYPLMLLPPSSNTQNAFFYVFKALIGLLDQAELLALL